MNKKAIQLTPFFCALFFAIFLGLAAGNQVLGISRDYDNYLDFFNTAGFAPDYLSIQDRFEPGFTTLVYWLAHAHVNNSSIYSLISGVFIFVIYFSIKYSKRYWIVLFVFTFYFLTRYFSLFEMTVLRASCAFSLAFYVFFQKQTDNFRIKDILILLTAVMFHYSAIIFTFIYLIKPTSPRKIIFIAGSVFAFIYLAKDIAITYLPEYMTVFSTYHDYAQATFLPIPFAVDILFLMFALLNFSSADVAMRYALLGISLSLSFHFSLLDFSLIAARFRELLSVFILIYVTRAMSCTNRIVRYGSLIYVVLTGFLNLYACLIYDPLFS